MRSRTGSLFPLIALTAVAFILALNFFCQIAIQWLSYQTTTAAAEAAALAAANELAQIVIEDPHFGFVSLTDWPAGQTTFTKAGEPMPVLGINTIMSTCRFNLLVANKLDNVRMMELAKRDSLFAVQCAKSLQEACLEALQQESSKRPTDRNGKQINAYDRSRRVFVESLSWLKAESKIEKFNLDLGYLEGACPSMTALPRPAELSQVPEQCRYSADYCACVNIPVANTDFHFAALAPTSSLVTTKQFQKADSKRISSVLRSEATLIPFKKGSSLFSIFGDRKVTGVACALPGANRDLVPPAVMVLNFPHGRAGQLCSFSNMLSAYELARERISIQHSQGGDFPDDAGAQLIAGEMPGTESSETVSNLIAKGFYDWLRSCHGKARLDSVLNMVSNEFPGSQSSPQSLVYGLQEDGQVKLLESKSFLVQTVHDQQDYAASNSTNAWGKTWTFTWRDEVSRLGKLGGKHGGRPLVERKGKTEIERIYPRHGLAVAMEFSSPM